MDKEKSGMVIDPEKFAYTVLASHSTEGSSMEEVAKKQLTLYLVSYFLAEKFNNLELQYFEGMKESEYEQLMLKLSSLRAFR